MTYATTYAPGSYLKTCNKCKRELYLKFFRRSRKAPDGREMRCKDCRATQQRKYRHAKRDADIERYRLQQKAVTQCGCCPQAMGHAFGGGDAASEKRTERLECRLCGCLWMNHRADPQECAA